MPHRNVTIVKRLEWSGRYCVEPYIQGRVGDPAAERGCAFLRQDDDESFCLFYGSEYIGSRQVLKHPEGRVFRCRKCLKENE